MSLLQKLKEKLAAEAAKTGITVQQQAIKSGILTQEMADDIKIRHGLEPEPRLPPEQYQQPQVRAQQYTQADADQSRQAYAAAMQSRQAYAAAIADQQGQTTQAPVTTAAALNGLPKWVPLAALVAVIWLIKHNRKR